MQRLTVNFLERKEILFQGFSELSLNLLCSCARVNCSDEPLFYLESRELVFVHPLDTEHAKGDNRKNEEGHDSLLGD